MFLSLLWRSMMKPHFLHVRACLMLKFLLHSHALGFRNNGRSYLMLTRSQNSYLLWMYHLSSIGRVVNHHWTKTEVFIVDIFSKCDQIRIWIRNLRFWSHLLKKFIMKNLIFLSSACWSALLSVVVVQPDQAENLRLWCLQKQYNDVGEMSMIYHLILFILDL